MWTDRHFHSRILASSDSGHWRVVSTAIRLLEILYVAVIRIPMYVRTHQIDLLYANNDTARIMTLLAGALSGAKVIWHMRNVKHPRWYSLLSRCPVISKLVFISQAQQNLFSVPRRKATLIYNGIDTEEYAPGTCAGTLRAEYGIPNSHTVFGVAGRMIPKKGFDHFLQAGRELKRRQGHPVSFVIISGAAKKSQQNYLSEIIALSKRLDLTHDVIVTGFRADIKPLLADVNVLVVPSLWDEPFGRTAIEAMSMEIPVVAYRTGGLSEVLSDDSGILCEPNDVMALSKAMAHLTQPDVAKKMGRTARRRVQSQFDIVNVTRLLENEIDLLFGA